MAKDDEARLTQLREIFGFFEQGGVMQMSNLPTAIRAMDLNPSEKQLIDWQRELDQGSGTIDFDTFRTFMLKQLNEGLDTKEMLINAFRVFDKAGCGFIETKELRSVMMSMGEIYTEEEFAELIRHSDNDGWIKYEQLADRLLMTYQALGDELTPVPEQPANQE
mmetsp:Transcript_109141/g.189091  ORF Transcript_109141/g.189091 Transcript_109141/m.189091 type:complete len:164 (-) Transcript_109141:1051-1542(-)